MGKNKVFYFFYGTVLAVFLVSGAALAMRLTQQRQGKEFYEQMGGAEIIAPFYVSDSISPVAPAASENAAHKILPVEYPDMAAWLQIPGTPVDYPVMFGKDNEFYLDHLPDGHKNVLGSLFFDCRLGKDSQNLIIYGHNGAGGKMFGSLKRFESQDYFLEHSTLTLITPDALYVCPVFSVRRVEADSDAYELDFGSDEDFFCYVEQAADESLYPVDMDFGNIKKVLTLSTCTGLPGQRLVIQAALMSINGM